MVWNALNSVNPDLGYWMSEYYILHKNNEIGGGGRRNLTMKTALYVDRIIHTMVLPLCPLKIVAVVNGHHPVPLQEWAFYLDDGSQGQNWGNGRPYRESPI